MAGRALLFDTPAIAGIDSLLNAPLKRRAGDRTGSGPIQDAWQCTGSQKVQVVDEMIVS
jgi:hypothetical protein